jgi:hypothetical protein
MGDRKQILFLSNDAPEDLPNGVSEMPIRWSDDIRAMVNIMIDRFGAPPMAITIHADDTGMDYTLSFVWPNKPGEVE